MPLQHPQGRTRTASMDLGHSAAIRGSSVLPSEFHSGYALSPRLDLSSEETGVNQLVLDIVETLDQQTEELRKRTDWTDWKIELMVFIHYIRILSSVTMPTCDVLLHHFRKMLLYTQGYVVAYSHLLSTLAPTQPNITSYSPLDLTLS